VLKKQAVDDLLISATDFCVCKLMTDLRMPMILLRMPMIVLRFFMTILGLSMIELGYTMFILHKVITL